MGQLSESERREAAKTRLQNQSETTDVVEGNSTEFMMSITCGPRPPGARHGKWEEGCDSAAQAVSSDLGFSEVTRPVSRDTWVVES